MSRRRRATQKKIEVPLVPRDRFPRDQFQVPQELVISYPESTQAPSFGFFLGFLLGDGSIHIRIRISKGSPSFIPNIIIYQKADANATLVFALLSKYLNSIGVKSTVITPNKAGQTSLRIEGVLAVGLLIPLFREYFSLGY